MLRRNAEALGAPKGEPVVEPVVQSTRPESSGDGSLTLHLTARAEGTDPINTGWHGFPSENWIVLSKEEVAWFLPPDASARSWEIDPEVATTILTHFDVGVQSVSEE